MAASRIGQASQGGGVPASMKMSFNDFGELARAFLGPDVRATQLDRGPFEGGLSLITVGPVRVAHVRSSRAGSVAGALSPGYRTFDLPMMSHTEAQWCGRKVSAGSITGYDRSGELEAMVPAGFECVMFAIEETACSRPSSGATSLLGHGRSVWEGSSVAVDGLRADLLGALQAVLEDPGLARQPIFLQELVDGVPSRLGELIGTQLGPVVEEVRSLRAHGLARALDMVDSRGPEVVTVQDLCDATGVSLRSLRRAFQERFAVAPKQYLTARRLNEVRRDLRSSDPASSGVTDIAGRWGFWHMGQFAADYRRLFGELPSATLRDRTMLRSRVAVAEIACVTLRFSRSSISSEQPAGSR